MVRQAGFAWWAVVAAASRLPLAMMPLSLVLLGSAGGGSLSRGGLLAGAFTAGEVVAAPLVASRISVSFGLAMMGAGAVGLAAAAQYRGPGWVLVLLAAGMGVTGAGVPGQLRAHLASLLPVRLRPAGYGLETTASAAFYAAGPALVAVLAGIDASAAPLAYGGLLLVSAPLGLRIARQVRASGAAARQVQVAAVLVRVWPLCLGAAAFMASVTALDVAIPGLLSERGHNPGASGYLLGGFAASGVVGGLVYAARTWPGSRIAQSTVVTLGMCGLLAFVPLVAETWLLATLIVLAGVFGPPSLISRSVHAEAVLAPPELATGFSALSAAAGLGASLAAFGAAFLVAEVAVATALWTILGVTATFTVLAAVMTGGHAGPTAAGATKDSADPVLRP